MVNNADMHPLAKTVCVVTTAAAMALTPAACSSMDFSQPSTSVKPSEPKSWNEPKIGEWPDHILRGIGYGEPFVVEVVYVDTYSGVVQAPPTFTAYDGNEVTMSQEVLITRVDTSSTYASDRFQIEPDFMSGRNDADELNPTARNGNVSCKNEIPNIGDTSICTFSARALVNTVRNSFWLIGNSYVGAWPGQQTFGY